jgi:hypothetical protein
MKKVVEDVKGVKSDCEHPVQYQVAQEGIVWQICKGCKRCLEVRKDKGNG